MTTSYPAALDVLTNPTAGQSQVSLSHSAQHANANDAIEAIETRFGIGPATPTVFEPTALTLAALQAAVTAAISTGGIVSLRRGATYAISASPISIVSAVRIAGNGATITQATKNVPVFDVIADGVSIENLTLNCIAATARTYTTVTDSLPSFRGSDAYVYGSAIWHAGNRGTFRNIKVDGWTAGVFLSDWNGAVLHSGVLMADNVVNGLRISNTDFGVLAIGQLRPWVNNLTGTPTKQAGSPNPEHIIYWSDGDTLDASASQQVLASNCAANGGTSYAYQFKGVKTGRIINCTADGSGGLLTWRACADFGAKGLTIVNAAGTGGNGVIYVEGAGTEKRLSLEDISIDLAVEDRCIRLDGDDSSMNNIRLYTNHTAAVGYNDVTINGLRNSVTNVKQFNKNSAGGGVVIAAAGGSGHTIRDIEARGALNTVVISAGVTGCTVDVDPSLTTHPGAAGFVVIPIADTIVKVRRHRLDRSAYVGTNYEWSAQTTLGLSINSTSAFTIPNPTSPAGAAGGRIELEILNNSAGVLTFLWGTQYQFGPAWVMPAAGKRARIAFEWNATNWQEVGRVLQT